MRNARRHTTASDATRVQKHQANVYGQGRQSYLAYIEGPGGYPPIRCPIFANAQDEAVCHRTSLGSVPQAPRRSQRARPWCLMWEPWTRRLAFADSRDHLAIYAIRGAQPMQLVFTNTKGLHEVTVEISILRISGPPGVNCPIRGTNLTNTQCEALRRRSEVMSSGTKRTSSCKVSVSKQGIAHVHTRNFVWRKVGVRRFHQIRRFFKTEGPHRIATPSPLG